METRVGLEDSHDSQIVIPRDGSIRPTDCSSSGNIDNSSSGDNSLVLAHYRSRETEGWNRYISLYGPEWRAKCEQYQLENLAQVYTTLKYSGSDYRLWGRRFVKSLGQQGFEVPTVQVPGVHVSTQIVDSFDRGDDLGERSESRKCPVSGKLSHCLDP